MKLPSVRFIRCYDVMQSRMVNVWLNVTTKDQFDNAPLATECTVTAPTVEECMVEIRKWQREAAAKWGLTAETIEEIEKASKNLIPAQDSVYKALNA